ncbi:MFS sugar transporter [Apiospora saccharicola]
MPSPPGAGQTSSYNRKVVAFAALGSMSPPSGEPGYDEVTTPAIATANGLLSAGAAVACLAVMWTGDRFGRVRNLQAGSLLGILGGALQGAAQNLAMFQAGRFVMGLCIGLMVTVTPMYLSEISHPRRRGWLVGHHAIFLVLGYMLASWNGYAVYFAPNRAFGWRFPLCFQVSPRWLVSRNRHDEAWAELQRLRRCPEEDPDDAVAREELREIQDQIALDRQKLLVWGGNPWRAVLSKRSYQKRMIIGFLTQWGAEFGGPLIIVNSRRWMFITGFVGITITTSCLAAMIACFAGTDNRAGNAMGVFFIFLYLAFQGTFCDTTMYIYISEIFPTEIRSIGMGFSLFGQFAATIILLQTAPIGFAAVGWEYLLVVICWSAVFVPIIYFFFPETSQLSLEEVERQFGDEVVTHTIQQQKDEI